MDILKLLFNWLIGNWDNILVVVIFVGVLAFAWFKLDKKEWVKSVLFKLVVAAEKEYGADTGLIKYNHVIDEFYKVMPAVLKIFITRKMIDMYVEEAVERLKDMLASGKMNLEGNYKDSYKPIE